MLSTLVNIIKDFVAFAVAIAYMYLAVDVIGDTFGLVLLGLPIALLIRVKLGPSTADFIVFASRPD